MNSTNEYSQTFRLAYWLRHPEYWTRVIPKLGNPLEWPMIEGLIEVIYRPPSAKAAQAAIEALEPCEHSAVIDALQYALGSPHVYVRLAALRALQNRRAFALAPVVSRLLDRDSSWLIRRAALEFLSQCPDQARWRILKASSDPHWRVRHELIQVLLGWKQSGEDQNSIVKRLSEASNDLRTKGVISYLHFHLSGQPQESLPTETDDPETWCDFWDWDPAVLAWRLGQMLAKERRAALGIMPRLIGHEDERVRRFAALPLRQDGQAPELLKTLRWLDDPRHEAFPTVNELMEKLDWERTESLVQAVFDLANPTPGQWVWALEQMEMSVSMEDVPRFLEVCKQALCEGPRVRAALARTLTRTNIEKWQSPLSELLQDSHPDVVLGLLEGTAERLEREIHGNVPDANWEGFLSSSDPDIRAAAAAVMLRQNSVRDVLSRLVGDPCSMVRVVAAKWLAQNTDPFQSEWLYQLQQDENPLVRAAALTESRAKDLLQNPARETSWLVLEEAAKLGKTPLWKIAPEQPPHVIPTTLAKPALLTLPEPASVSVRTLGSWQVSPLGISGHYGLPVGGFVRAIEAGVNLMFWEPNYQTLTTFMGRITPSERRRIRMVTGTFEADPARIQKDVDRALDKLQLEQITVFLLFWTRSWNRITDSVREMLERLQHAGKIGTYGLSTHSRTLAMEAIETGWNPVMVRHSAAHRGAESLIFPKAKERGTDLLTFNNTCYGRLLEAFPEESGLTAADCYRYTHSFDAVTACWSAPGTLEELETNLMALHSTELPQERRELLLEVGRRVYAEDTVFRQLVRSL